MNDLKLFLMSGVCGAAWVLMCCTGFMFVVRVKEGEQSSAALYLVLLFLQVHAVIGLTLAVVQSCTRSHHDE